jgi:tetratricopeptide (TPR) repeat protein
MRQQNSVDNGLIFAYDIARHLRASRKLGLGRLLGCLLTIAVLLLLQGVICPSGYADNFPGKGSRQAWLDANKYLNEAIDLNRQQRYEEAIKRLQAAVAVYPHDPAYFHSMGYAFEKKGDLVAAEGAYKKALSMDSRDWRTWNALKNVFYKQGRYQESKQACLNALECNPPKQRRANIQAAIQELDQKLRPTKSVAGAQP